ncbi:MAG: hypothetical protein CM1200mP29_03310 [Verrucomicrobiota bacterium]|nr:MAG: hypothetical protein CM1200mP29_03310 [Verrucomicrobiota bacterium]
MMTYQIQWGGQHPGPAVGVQTGGENVLRCQPGVFDEMTGFVIRDLEVVAKVGGLFRF